jgi:hypothetical protein
MPNVSLVALSRYLAPSSSGLGHYPLKVAAKCRDFEPVTSLSEVARNLSLKDSHGYCDAII